MKASSESGLCATRIVRVVMDVYRSPFTIVRLAFELLQYRRMIQVLHALRSLLRVEVSQEVAFGPGTQPGVIRKITDLASDDIGKQVSGRLCQDRVREGGRGGCILNLELEHGGMVACVDVDYVQLAIRAQRHWCEPLDLRRIPPFRRLHDSVEQAIEPLPRCHAADVWCGSAAAVLTGRRSGARTRIRHIGSRYGCRAGHPVGDAANQQQAECPRTKPHPSLGRSPRGARPVTSRLTAAVTETGLG